MKNFSSGFIDRLNAQESGGVFLKAAILTETTSPLVKKYFVDFERTITFDGNAYTPLPMRWEGSDMGAGMALPTVNVTVPNIGGEVINYLEGTDLLGNEVVLQIFHLDLLGTPTDVDKQTLYVMTIQGNLETAVFRLGLNMALGEMLPRHVITRKEFPGVPDDIRWASIL